MSNAEQLGKKGYRVLGVLGRGGMGEVYRAVRDNDGLQVALKVLMLMPTTPLQALRHLSNVASFYAGLPAEIMVTSQSARHGQAIWVRYLYPVVREHQYPMIPESTHDMMTDLETMTDLVEAPFSQDDHTQQELVLVLAWSVEHQERIGEVMVCPEGEAQLLGRSSSKSKGHSEGPPMGVWQRQRPGASEATGPLEDRRLSRRQLVVERQGEALQVTNIGRCPMLYRGIEMGSCTLKPGEAVILQHVAVLLCAVRPSGWDGPWPQGPQPDTSFPFGQADAQGIVGESPACWALRRQLMFMAQRRQHVLLLGASGTGKELAARAVHALSERSEQAWVARNASTIPENLFDAELFGNTRGYPNPGMPERAGLVGEADRGTLFLDELGELPEALQAHLLRLMDRGGEYHRLGEARPRRADVRLLGATNRSEENLKHDLLARFAMRLNLPTLNARREDVPLLAIHMLQRAAAKDPGLVPLIFNAHQERLYPRLTPELVQGLLLHRYTHHAHELDTLLWSSITAVVSNPADHADRQGRVWLHLTEPLRQQLASSDHAAAHDLEMPTQDEPDGSASPHSGTTSEAQSVLSDELLAPDSSAASSTEALSSAGVLLVSQDGRAFRLPSGESVSLGRRRAPRRILQRLVEHRQSEADDSLSVYDLMEAGWPGEKLHPEAGTNRVYVAVTILRNLGLRELLVYRDEGYLLDPSVPVVVVPREQLES